MSAPWPLVGREAELATIAQAGKQGRCGVVVSAGAGTGKSRLGREALRGAQGDGALTAWVQATRSASLIPLGAFAGVLPDTERAAHPFNLLRDSAQLLRERAAGRPIVLGVDDAQLLDPASAALVLHLATREDVFTVATVRSGEPCPDAIVSLWKDAGAQRLELGCLSDEALARARGGGARRAGGGGGAALGRRPQPGQPAVRARARARRPRRRPARPRARPVAALGRLSVTASLVELVGGRLDALHDRASARPSSCSRSASRCTSASSRT